MELFKDLQEIIDEVEYEDCEDFLSDQKTTILFKGSLILDAFCTAFEQYSDIVVVTSAKSKIYKNEFSYLNCICKHLNISIKKFQEMPYSRDDIRNPSGNIEHLAAIFGIHKAVAASERVISDIPIFQTFDKNRLIELAKTSVLITTERFEKTEVERSVDALLNQVENMIEHRINFEYSPPLKFFDDCLKQSMGNVNFAKSSDLKKIIRSTSGRTIEKITISLQSTLNEIVAKNFSQVLCKIIEDSRIDIISEVQDKFHERIKKNLGQITALTSTQELISNVADFFDSPKTIKKRMNRNYVTVHIKNIFSCIEDIFNGISPMNVSSLKYIYLLYKLDRIFKPIQNFIFEQDYHSTFTFSSLLCQHYNKSFYSSCDIRLISDSLVKKILQIFLENNLNLSDDHIWYELFQLSYVKTLLQENIIQRQLSHLVFKYHSVWQNDNVAYLNDIALNFLRRFGKCNFIASSDESENQIIYKKQLKKHYVAAFKNFLFTRELEEKDCLEKNPFLSFEFVEPIDDNLICPLMLYKLPYKKIRDLIKKISFPSKDEESLIKLLSPLSDSIDLIDDELNLDLPPQVVLKKTILEWRNFFEYFCNNQGRCPQSESLSFGRCSKKQRQQCHNNFLLHLKNLKFQCFNDKFALEKSSQ